MGDRFDVVGKIYTSTISRLIDISKRFSLIIKSMLTSGDSSCNITAPRVSTLIILGVGRDGVDMRTLEGRADAMSCRRTAHLSGTAL